METKNLVGVVLAITVSLICIGTVMMPVLTDATTTAETFTNDGGYYPMAEILDSDEGTYTLEWVKTNAASLTINGVEYEAYGDYGGAITTVVAAETWLVRYNSISGFEYLQFFNGTNYYGSDSSKSVTVSATGGTATITVIESTDNTRTTTATYDKLYVIDPSADVDIMKKPTETPYVRGDSEIYAMGRTTISDLNTAVLIRIVGNVDDGVTVDVIGVDDEVISNIEIHKTSVDRCIDLYQIEKITFDLEMNEVTQECTYSYFIVPYEVTAELSSHLSSTEIALITVIPVMTILAVLMIAVRVVTRD